MLHKKFFNGGEMIYNCKCLRDNISILIADDNQQMRESLNGLFSLTFPEPHINYARNGQEAISEALEKKPEIIIMDIKMPLLNGIQATEKIKKTLPDTEVIILTIHDNQNYYNSAMSAGASAFISKQRAGSELIPIVMHLLNQKKDMKPKGEKNE
jgi:DNA-binding NarL/FixJ family response regulator